jgi:hypothetical protein
MANRIQERDNAPAKFFVWLRCRLHRSRIDRELADGASPDTDPCRHRRACELTARSEREKLASSIDALLALRAKTRAVRVVPVNWRGVQASSRRLEQLARRLRGESEVTPQGVARAARFLGDMTSPLFIPEDELGFAAEVRTTLALL